MSGSSTYAIVGQAVNSALMFSMVIVAAHLVSPSGLGVWSLGIAIWTIGVMVNRAVIVTGSLVAEGDRNDPLAAWRTGAGFTASSIIGVVTACGIVGLSLYGDDTLSSELPLFAMGVVFYIPYDTLRFRQHQLGAARSAALMEVARAALFFLLIATTSLAGKLTLFTLSASFALSNLAVLVAVGFLVAVRPSFSALRRMIADEGPRYGLLFVESAMNAAAANAPVIVATLAVGAAEGGAARIAFTVAGGMGVIITAVLPVSTLKFVRSLRQGTGLVRLYLNWSWLISGFGAVYGLIILFIPDSIGRLIGGASWELATIVLLPVALELALRGFLNGAPLALRSALLFRSVVVLRLVSSILILLFSYAGAALAGISGLFWGFLVAQVVSVCMGIGLVWLGGRMVKRA